MKKYIYIGIVILISILVLYFTISLGVDIYIENKIEDIKSTRNSLLDEYNNNRDLAIASLELYDIIDENSYQRVKNSIYEKLSSELKSQIFPSVNYKGMDYHERTVNLIRCIGSNNYNSENVFLIEYDLHQSTYYQRITTLVTINNGVITKIMRIK